MLGYRLGWLIVACAVVLGLPVVAAPYTETYVFTPAPYTDLYDLNHEHYYSWGIDWAYAGAPEDIVSATLTFHDIWNDDPITNKLFMNLLDSAPAGVTRYYDSNAVESNAFTEGPGVHLFATWSDPDLGFPNRTTESFALPSSYYAWLTDGNFGLGLDPDCKFFNNGVDLTIVSKAPELPPGLLLAAVPFAGLVIRRFRRH